MSKIWVRNVTTNDINKVGSLSFGADDWQEAYNEMISKGYLFELGKPKGGSYHYWGLYLVNPLDINIEPSDYDVVNRLNEKIKEAQEQNIGFETQRKRFFNGLQEGTKNETTQDLSLKQLLKELESAYRRASENQKWSAMCFAPAGAVNALINEQKKAYEMLVEKFKISSLQEKIETLKDAFKSKDLTHSVKIGLFEEGIDSFDELIQSQELSQEQNQETTQDLSLKQLLKELESACRRAAENQKSSAMWFAPAGAVDALINAQKKAYEMLVEKFKTSSLQEKIEILKAALTSNDLNKAVKIALFEKGIDSFDEFMKNEQRDGDSKE